MSASLNIIALVPFGVHALTGVAALMNWNAIDAKRDTQDYWMKTLTNTLSIYTSTDYAIQYYSAIIQIMCAVAAAVTHFLGPLKLRRLSYAILLTLCSVTLARHYFNSDGPSMFGCFYCHIAFYVMLVFYQQNREDVPQMTKAKLQ